MIIALIILGLVALVFLVRKLREDPSPNTRRMTGALAVLLLLMCVAQYEISRATDRRQLREALPIFDYHTIVGCGLAQAANAALPDGGPVVVITVSKSLSRETEQFIDAQVKGVLHYLNPKLSIIQTEEAPPNVFREGGELPADVLAGVLQRNPGAKAVISFVGVPSDPSAAPSLGKPEGPKLVAYVKDPRRVTQMIAAGQVAAIVCQKSSAANTPPPADKSTQSILKTFYLILTADNLAEHPEFSPSQ